MGSPSGPNFKDFRYVVSATPRMESDRGQLPQNRAARQAYHLYHSSWPTRYSTNVLRCANNIPKIFEIRAGRRTHRNWSAISNTALSNRQRTGDSKAVVGVLELWGNARARRVPTHLDVMPPRTAPRSLSRAVDWSLRISIG